MDANSDKSRAAGRQFMRGWIFFRLAVLFAFAFGNSALATVTLTPATGGTNILADKAANATAPAWTTLGPIVITERTKSDFGSGSGVTLVLKAPAGFQFNTSAPPNVTFAQGQDISSASITMGNPTTITVTLTVSGTSGTDQLTIGNSNGIQVQPIAGTPLASGQIYRPQTGGGTAAINGISTSANSDGSGGSDFGSLSDVAGVAAKLVFTTQPGAARTGSIFGTQPVVKSQDQFGNNSTTNLAASVTVSMALTSGTGLLLGTTNLNIGTGAGNGTVTYTNLEIDGGGTNKQLTASAPGLASALSSVFTVNSPPAVSSLPNLTSKEGVVATNFFTISDLETPADSLILTASSSNTSLMASTNIVFSGTGTNRMVMLYPVTNAVGTSTITITVSDGSLTSSNAFVLTVISLNDPPTLNALTNWSILEDAGIQTVNLAGISPGPSNESTQTLTITATSSNPSLISNPVVNYTNPSSTGTLSFAPSTNQFGTAAITVVVKDNGGTANGGIDSITNSFTVTVLAVNDPPSLDPISDLVVGPNTGQTITLTGISPGPSSESSQVVTITAISSNPSVVPNPTVNYTNPNSSGTLTLAPATDATGSATITVTAQDNGGTVNGGQNAIVRQFTVTVTPVADLAISQTAIPNPAFQGGNITFQLTVTNLGPTAATNIVVTNTLPAGIASSSVTPSQGTATNYGSLVVWSLDTLTNGGVATVNVVVQPVTLGACTNSASLWSAVPDPNLANNSSTVVDSVGPSQFVISGTALVSESCADGSIDPGERVTVSFALQNLSGSNTTNLVATLDASGGVTAPGPAQTYGVLIAGGPPVSRNFTFTPVGDCGGTFVATLRLQDGAVSLGTATITLTFGQLVGQTVAFTNGNFIYIPGPGQATPYPSVINVSGLSTNLQNVTVTLNQVTHSDPGALEILLVGPGGQATWLMSDCGDANSINQVVLTFDNAAATGLPNQGQIVSGKFKPTDYPPDDVIPAPAPAGPYVADLAVFQGTNPNGTWQLFVYDDTPPLSGYINGGWSLNLTTLRPACCVDGNSVDVALIANSAAPNPVVVGNNVTFTVVATNQGPATATGVTITNAIPSNANFVSASSSQGSCTTNGGAVVCSLGTMTNGAVATMSVTYQTMLLGTVSNVSTIIATQPDHAMANNTASGSAQVTVPVITVGDAIVVEPSSGTTNAAFAVTFSAPSSQIVSVNYLTADNSATAGSDYYSTNGLLTFSPGQTSKSVVVAVIGSPINKPTEFFNVLLTNAVNATIGRSPATGTILNTNPLPSLSINNVTNADGSSGTTNFVFTVSLAPASGQAVYVNFATADGSAKAGTDYYSTNGTITFNPGETSKTAAVAVIGTAFNKSNLLFYVNLSGVVNAVISQSQGTGMILNDDFLPVIAAAGATLATENCSPANGVIDPNESVTVNFALRNVSAGTATTTNLTATLLQMGGIVLPGAAQNYGAVTPGGPAVSRPFSFTANGICGDTLMAVLQLQDGANSLGRVTNFLTMGKATFVTNNFVNAVALTIPDVGPASSYPSTINVSGLSGNVTRITATLSGLSHTYPSDLEMLLVGPAGQKVLLMSDAGVGLGISNVTLTFDDNAASLVPYSTQILSGTYQPTDYPPDDGIPLPAPPGPYGTNLSVFNGASPNGSWSLYVDDDSPGDSGSLSGGWSLRISSTGTPICCGVNSMADLKLGLASSATAIGIGSNITYTINVTNSGPNTASDVAFIDTLPTNVNFVSATSTIGTPTNINGVVTCSLGTMTNGARASLTIVVTTTAAGPASNSAAVSSRAADPNPGNSSATNLTTVLPPAHLAINPANLNFDPVVVGQTTNLSFQVLNTGGLTLTGSASASQAFSVLSGSPFTVPGSGSTNVVVSFGPTVVGGASNVVVFTSNGGSSTNSVTGLGWPVGEIAVSPPSVSFGYVAVGASAQASFGVTNIGGGAVTNVVVSVGSGFTILSSTPFRLAGFGATNVVVQFAPSNAASFNNAVVFLSDGGNRTNIVSGIGAFVPVAGFSASPTLGAWPLDVTFTNTSTGTITNVLWDFGDGTITNTASATLIHTYTFRATNSVSLTVTGPVGTNTLTRSNYVSAVNAPQLVIGPTHLDFGTVATGRTHAQTFELVNIGDLHAIGSVISAPPFYPDTNSFDIGPGQTGYVAVAFSPASLGDLSNVVVFAGNGGNFTNSVTGTGITPAQLSVSPPSFDFGTVAVGFSAQASFTATNLGQETLAAGSVTVDGGAFTILSGASFDLAGFGSTNIILNFAPTDATPFSNVLVIATGNAGNSTNAVSGYGAFVPFAGFSATPTNGFWPLMVSFSDSSTGTITNRFWDFGDGWATNTQVAGVMHNYSRPGSYTVRLTVNGPVGTSTVVAGGYVVVTNRPPMLVATPANLDFGPLIVGQSRTQVFVVYNDGQLVLNGGCQVSGDMFQVVGGSPFSVPPSQTGLVKVVFSPSQPGNFSGNAAFSSNGGNSTNGLSGTGLAPAQIIVSPPGVDFGVFNLGTSSTTSLLVTNLGDLAASNVTASVVSGPFSVLSGSPFDLPAHGSSYVQIQFAPVSEGAFSNNIVFVTANAGNSTNPVTGTGRIPLVASFSGSPTSGTAALAVNFSDASTGHITNRFWNFGDGSTTNIPQGGTINFTHVYQLGGTYTVSLRVSDTFGSNSMTRASYINTVNAAPTANFVAIPTDGSAPFPANFIDQSSGTITNRFWDFGDGSTTNTTATQVVHFYAAGTYGVKLTVTGPLGSNTKRRNNYITVTNAPAKLLVTPALLDFGGVAVGRTNTAPFQVVNLGSFSLTGSGSISAGSVFSLAGGSPFTLNGGQTSVVLVAFSPTLTVNYATNVVFTSSAGNSINNVTGSGLTPALLAVTPSSLDFGTIAVGSSAQATLVLTNQGQAALSNGVATTSGPFALLSPDASGFSLAGFGSTNLVVSFAPTSAGSFSNVAVVSSDGGNSINSLTGIAAPVPVAHFVANPTAGLEPLLVNFTDDSTGTITNRFWTFGDNSSTNTTDTALTHTYLFPGTSSVTLTVTGPYGSNTFSRADYILVTGNLLITSIRVSGSDVIVSFLSSASASYSLEYTDTLAPADWKTAVSPIPGNGGMVTATQVGGATGSVRYYRIRQL